MHYDSDVIVVGGGIAGATAARELTQRGATVIVLEARDRLGGRTWTRATTLGPDLDMGGTWVHWIQPHVWAEISRYQLQLCSSPEPDTAYWRVGSDIRNDRAEVMLEKLDSSMTELLRATRQLLPHPYELTPLSDQLKALDSISVAEKIDEQALPAEEHALLDGMWALNFSADPARGAYTQAVRWSALSGGDWRLMFEACATLKFVNGTRDLLDAIVNDAVGADFRLNTAVVQIDEVDDGVVVTTADGQTLRSRRVVVTLPLNILNSIAVSPALDHGIRAVADEGQASTGVKVWIRVRGDVGKFVALADSSAVLNFVQHEYSFDGDTVLVAFGPRSGRIDLDDPKAVEAELRKWRPDLEVVAVDAHDWSSDPLSGETWPMLAPGQLDAVQKASCDTTRAVRLAGSDYAQGWAGFIDGAIESGMQAARQILTELQVER